jgi:hypothetical protein
LILGSRPRDPLRPYFVRHPAIFVRNFHQDLMH